MLSPGLLSLRKTCSASASAGGPGPQRRRVLGMIPHMAGRAGRDRPAPRGARGRGLGAPLLDGSERGGHRYRIVYLQSPARRPMPGDTV
eukprot:scaffold1837_cov391-Prasinococcus_capsulatus_cf.AAC.8